jgi:predicted nucleic acid-binding protein
LAVIVVDSSVWIAYFRGLDIPCVRALDAIGNTDLILVGDVVLLELLQGARSDADAKRIERLLLRFNVIGMLDPAVAVVAAANYRRLRALGITIRKTADLIIATFCIENDHDLLHNDRDFTPFAEHLGLRTL